jgi:hypothetical protein
MMCSRESGFSNGGPPQQETYTHVNLHLQETSTSVFSISYTTIDIRYLILQSLNLAFDRWRIDQMERFRRCQDWEKTTLASQPQPSAFRPSNIQDGPSVALFRSAEHAAAPQLKRTFGSLDSVIDDQQ